MKPWHSRRTIYSIEWKDIDGRWISTMTYSTKKELLKAWNDTIRVSNKEGRWHLGTSWRMSTYRWEACEFLKNK